MKQIQRLQKLMRILLVPAWRRALFRHGVAAGAEHEIVLRQLGKISTVVDIGANRGQFALVARRCFPSARIASFEPLPKPSNVYRSVFLYDEKADLKQVAIGPDEGNFTIHVSRRDDSSSLLPISDVQDAVFPGTAEVGTEIIEAGPLTAHFLRHPNEENVLLKMDVQGFELQALVGCEDLLVSFAWIYVECSFVELYEGQAFADEVIAWLRDRGFVLSGVYNVSYQHEGKAVQADFLFKRRT